MLLAPGETKFREKTGILLGIVEKIARQKAQDLGSQTIIVKSKESSRAGRSAWSIMYMVSSNPLSKTEARRRP